MTSALVGGEWLASRPGRFTPGGKPPYPLDRRLVGPQSHSGRHGEEKFLDPTGTELRPSDRPARSQSLYRLRYPGCSKETFLSKFSLLIYIIECIYYLHSSYENM
jgi:hypothetical protein